MIDNEIIISLRLNEEIVRKLEKACIAHRKSMDNVVSELINKHL